MLWGLTYWDDSDNPRKESNSPNSSFDPFMNASKLNPCSKSTKKQNVATPNATSQINSLSKIISSSNKI